MLLASMAVDGIRVQTCVTSPPYFGLRDYGHADQIGLERTPEEYVAQLVQVFANVRNVLADDGTLWLNLGDSYAGSWGAQGRQGKTGQMADRSIVSARQIEAHPKRTHTGSLSRFRAGNPDKNGGNSNRDGVGRVCGLKAKDMIGIPWRVAFALQADGWYLRSDIIWHKPNPMPESVTDRPTKAHEYLFLLSKSDRYYYDSAAIAEASVGEDPISRMSLHDGLKAASLQSLNASTLGTPAFERRNRRTVWTVTTSPQPEAHFATFPPELIEPCILGGTAAAGIVLDPFMGSGTTARVALSLGRRFIGCELNAAYAAIQDKIGLQSGMAI